MAIKIQTQDTFIPVEIGDLTLKFDVSDDSLVTLRKKIDNIQKTSENINTKGDDSEVLESVKDVIRTAYDDVFGEGTYDKVYEISPSVIITTQYFLDIGQGIGKEMDERGLTLSSHEKAKKYLQNKNKK